MAQPEAVFFDLDGTLIDTAPDFIHAVNSQRRHLKMEDADPVSIRNTVSNGARALIHLSFGYDEAHPDYTLRLNELLDLYLACISNASRLFSGLDDLLLSLEQRGIPWGIITNKPRRYTTPLLEGLALTHRSAITICPDDVTHRKPHPEPMHLACRHVGVDPARCIYVGDHERDIQAGKNAGMKTIAAQYGYLTQPSEAEAWQADAVAASSEALALVIESIDC